MIKIIITFFLIAFSAVGQSQIKYSGKIEIGSLAFNHRFISVDPGPNWKGYNLQNEQNGIDINAINGFLFNDKIYIGIGVGYLNFEGISGGSIFTDFEYLPFKTKLTPLANIKIGYNHIWNQYKNGIGTAIAEFNIGINYKLSEKFNLYLKSGVLFTQQSSFTPIKIGLRF